MLITFLDIIIRNWWNCTRRRLTRWLSDLVWPESALSNETIRLVSLGFSPSDTILRKIRLVSASRETWEEYRRKDMRTRQRNTRGEINATILIEQRGKNTRALVWLKMARKSSQPRENPEIQSVTAILRRSETPKKTESTSQTSQDGLHQPHGTAVAKG